MYLTWEEIDKAIIEAKQTLTEADHLTRRIGRVIVGRLHLMPPPILKKLKKELREFNMVTGKWKGQ